MGAAKSENNHSGVFTQKALMVFQRRKRFDERIQQTGSSSKRLAESCSNLVK
jgi:hypothetical protein